MEKLLIGAEARLAGLAHKAEEKMGRLAKAANILRHEFLEVLPVTIFFLVGLHLIVFSKHLVLAERGIVYEGIAEATVGALVIAKVVLIVDKLAFMRLFSGRPLYRPILYRTVFYTFCVLLVRLLEALIRGSIKEGDFASGFEAARAEFLWAHFTFVQMWIFVLFLIYVLMVELRDELGIGSLGKFLFSHGKE